MKKKPREMRTTFGLIQALKDYDFKNYVGNKKYDTMECLVQLFHNFQQYQSWKVFIKKIHDLLQDQGMVGLITEPGNTEEWKKLLGDLTSLW